MCVFVYGGGSFQHNDDSKNNPLPKLLSPIGWPYRYTHMCVSMYVYNYINIVQALRPMPPTRNLITGLGFVVVVVTTAQPKLTDVACCCLCKLEPSWSQVGAKWSQVGPSWAKLGPSWDKLGQVGPSWGQVGPSWVQVRAKLGPSWSQVGPSWAKLGPGGGKLGPRWGQVGPKLDQVGDKRGQVEANLDQVEVKLG